MRSRRLIGAVLVARVLALLIPTTAASAAVSACAWPPRRA